MDFVKIAGPLRIDSLSDQAELKFKLPPRAGGRKAKVAQIMVKVLQRSSSNAKVGAYLEHSPDGTVSKPHSTPIAVQAATQIPDLLVGDADSTKVLGEHLHWILSHQSITATAEWSLVEVYVMTKAW